MKIRLLIWIILIINIIIIAIFSFVGLFRIPPTTATDISLKRTIIAGYPFYTETYGDRNNPPIVVIHGGPGGDFNYLKAISKLSNKFYVLLYDQRGCGRSARGESMEFTIESFIKDLDNIIKLHSRGKKTILLGHSFGGMLATAYISKYPENISKAVIMEPGMLNQETAKIFLSKIKAAQNQFELQKILEILAIFLKSIFVVKEDGHEMSDYILTKVMEMGNGPPYQCPGESLPNGSFIRAGYSVFSKMILPLVDHPEKFNYDLTKGLKFFKGKILLLSSECSFIGYDYQNLNHAKFYPKSTKHILIRGTGHNMITLKPDESLKIINEFLDQTD